jgi:hypothetical protein
MRSVVGITFLALIAQAAEQAANNTAAVDDDADLETMLSNMDDETMDKVADKLIDKLLGNLTGMFNLGGLDLNNTELFKMPTDAAAQPDREPTEEELKQIEEQAAAEAQAAAVLAAAAAETAQVLAAAFQDAYNNQDADNQDLSQLLSQFSQSQDYDREEVAPHAEDVCEGRDFNEAECQAQGTGCCFWENNACWAAVDGACPVATEEAPAEELDEQADEQAPDLVTVVFVGLASVVMGSAVTYALFKPRFSMMADKQLPLLTPA